MEKVVATKVDYVGALREAFAAPFAPGAISGCGRVYLVFVEKADVKGFKAAAKKLGKLYVPAFGLYVGYDNADGNALGKGAAMVEFLKSKGFRVYRDERED